MDEMELTTIKNRNLFQTNESLGGTYWLLPDNKEELKFKLNLTQTKVLKIAMAMVNPKEDIPNDDLKVSQPPKTYAFTIEEFMEIMDIKSNTRLQYIDMPKFLKELMTSDNFFYRNNKGKWTLIHIFDNITFDEFKREVTFRFSWNMIERLSSKNKGTYQTYKLQNILNFKSLYTVNLYEMLKRELRGRREYVFSIEVEDLRIALDVSEDIYPSYYEFKRNVLQKSTKEINEYKTDISVEFSEKRKGRYISTIIFSIKNTGMTVEELEGSNTNEVAVDIDYTPIDSDEDLVGKVLSFIEEPLTPDNAKSIIEAAKNDINLIAKMYFDYAKKSKKPIPNLTGWLITAVRNPEKYFKTSLNNKSGTFNNFKQRKYDGSDGQMTFDEIENKLREASFSGIEDILSEEAN